jgi:predicted transcriptional regulator
MSPRANRKQLPAAEKMFETRAEVDAYLANDKLQCLICGKRYAFLGGHIRQAHNISADGYRAKYNLPLSAPLAGIQYRAAHRDKINRIRGEGKLTITDKMITRMKKEAALRSGAKAKVAHSEKTQRGYIYKHNSPPPTPEDITAAIEKAKKTGDTSELRKCLKLTIADKWTRRWAARKKAAILGKSSSKTIGDRVTILSMLGLKTNNQAAKVAGVSHNTAAKYAEVLGVRVVEGKHGWTDEDVARLTTAFNDPNKMSKAANKAWKTKRKLEKTDKPARR